MSVTTFGELVTQAEHVLTPVLILRDRDDAGLAAAWPDFARRAVHAITAATGARDPRWHEVDRLLRETSRRIHASPVQSQPPARPDRGGAVILERAGLLLGAAGDVLASARRDGVGDPMLCDEAVRSAQARVAGLLASGAHVVARSLTPEHGRGRVVHREVNELARAVARVEAAATRVLHAAPSTRGRADDVAILSISGGDQGLVEVMERWGILARHTVREQAPSARDIQGLAADLARLATHSRALVRAATTTNLRPQDDSRRIDLSLQAAAAGWLDIAQHCTSLHTPTPPTPSKVAASHELGRALVAATRDGRDWAEPWDIAARVQLPAVLAAVRRCTDVGADVARRLPGAVRGMAASGQLFLPSTRLVATMTTLRHHLRQGLAPAGVGDVAQLLGRLAHQNASARRAREELTAAVRPPGRADVAYPFSGGRSARESGISLS